MPDVMRLNSGLGYGTVNQLSLKCQWIARAPIIIALEVKSIAVILIGSALGHRIRHTACSSTILGGIVRGINLKLLHSRLADRITDAGASAFFCEEGLIVIPTIYSVIVEQTGYS